MKEPSYLPIIQNKLDWEKVRERLSRYPYIARFYPLESLQACSDKPPFYCHYLGWRLGTWINESHFEAFNHLLEKCSGLPGWNKNTRIPIGCEFSNFWSFIWELQVAYYFAFHLGLHTEWLDSGPDFRIFTGSEHFFVECTTYQKSFGLEAFIDEVFMFVDPKIIVRHIPCIKSSLPKNNQIAEFLDELYRPYCDSSYLPSKIAEARKKSPVFLPVPKSVEGSLYIYFEDDDVQSVNNDEALKLHLMGDPLPYINTSHSEIVGNKIKSNDLKNSRPNLLMANLLLSRDYQTAIHLRQDRFSIASVKLESSVSEGLIFNWIDDVKIPDLQKTIDGIVFAICGIDKIEPDISQSLIYLHSDCHPVAQFLINDEKQRWMD